MNKHIKIIPLEKSHIADVINILQSISDYKPNPDKVLEVWDNFANQPNFFGFVAIKEGMIVGYGSILFVVKVRGGKMAQIEELAIHKNFQRQGIGKLILDTLYNLAVQEKCYKVTLSCRENNIQFYEKQNFSLQGYYLNKLL